MCDVIANLQIFPDFQAHQKKSGWLYIWVVVVVIVVVVVVVVVSQSVWSTYNMIRGLGDNLEKILLITYTTFLLF